MTKNLFKRIIWWSLKQFHLSIRKDYPRESHYFLKEYFGNKKISGAEIGVFYGVNSLWFLKMLNIKKLYLIDPYGKYEDLYDGKSLIATWNFQEIKDKAFRLLKRFYDKIDVKWIYETSDEAFLKNYVSDDLDFVYIDGNHQYEFVKRDIKNYWQKLKKGGVLIGHDFTFYSVAKAVIEFAKKNKLKVITKAKDWEWIIVKR